MERCVIGLVLPPESGSGQWFGVEAVGTSASLLDARRQAGPAGPRWQGDGFLLERWLGAGASRGWLQEAWLVVEHLRGSRRLEFVSGAMYLGVVSVRAVMSESVDGPAESIATQSLTANGEPAPARGLRSARQDVAGRIGFALAGSASFGSG